MDNASLQLESRFSYPPNFLGYCGEPAAAAKFRECIISGRCVGVEKEVRRFIVLYPYLKTIAEINRLPIFSYPVVEAYWLGNDLLKKVGQEDYRLLMKNFRKQGVPDWLIEELEARVPRVFIPNHLFQVLHVGVGRAGGAVPFNLKSINNCMVRWGRVEKISGGNLTANLISLKKEDSKYRPTLIRESVPLNHLLIPGLKVGDSIAVHWQQVTKILTAVEEKNLSFWTREIMA